MKKISTFALGLMLASAEASIKPNAKVEIFFMSNLYFSHF